MLNRVPPEPFRPLKTDVLHADLVVVGGGLAGTCTAIQAARAGIKVVLVQDRPVLGGNASSEVRLWTLGATCHMGSNNRWAREGGIVDEILVESLWRNTEGSSLIFDSILLEKVVEEKNITLLLNTAAFEVTKHPGDPDRIASVKAFCSQNSTLYECVAPLFVDASGDGIIGFLSGAAFRMGAEKKEEFGEGFAPDEEFGALLGDSLYFYSKDIGRPVTFVPPSFALKNVPERIPRFKRFNAETHGCQLWWIEYGGRLDTVHQAEEIKWELWRIVYGVWDYIKNSGNFPDAANKTLEWIGHIPGKRESRRFEGDYMLTQHDVVERRLHKDAVAYGGWSIDLHPADGVYSKLEGSHHLHSKGPYQIPYRCLYSRNIRNLFLAGRIISSSHVAFGTTRVMGTLSHAGQAVGEAAAICTERNLLPRDILADETMAELQQRLLAKNQHIPNLRLADKNDLAMTAKLTASSTLTLSEMPADGPSVKLEWDRGQLLPVRPGAVPEVTLWVDVEAETELTCELITTSRLDHHTPDVPLAKLVKKLPAGQNQPLVLRFDATIDQPRYVLVVLRKNPLVSVRTSERRLSGVLSLKHRRDEKTSHVGGEDYEVWTPDRRPAGQSFAMKIMPALDVFSVSALTNGVFRPTNQPNAWIADIKDTRPSVTLSWDKPQSIAAVTIYCDSDYDHGMETVLYQHPERAVPFCPKHLRMLDRTGKVLHEVTEHHQPTLRIPLNVTTDKLTIEVPEMNGLHTPTTLMGIRVERA
jgi:hypothetical protein